MSRLVLIRRGRVEDVIVADAQFRARAREYLDAFDATVELPDDPRPGDPGPGHVYDGARFAAPSPETTMERRASALAAASQVARDQIAAGFEFDGHRFSLSLEAQASMASTFLVRDRINWPIRWATIDDSAVIEIANAREFDLFYSSAARVLCVALEASHAQKVRALEASVREVSGDVRK